MGRRATVDDVVSELELAVTQVLLEHEHSDEDATVMVRQALVMLLAAMEITPVPGAMERLEEDVSLLRLLVGQTLQGSALGNVETAPAPDGTVRSN